MYPHPLTPWGLDTAQRVIQTLVCHHYFAEIYTGDERVLPLAAESNLVKEENKKVAITEFGPGVYTGQ